MSDCNDNSTPKPNAMDKATIDKARTARHMLPDPGPEVVGDLIATIDELAKYARHGDDCTYDESDSAACTCGLLHLVKVPEVEVVVKFVAEEAPPLPDQMDAASIREDERLRIATLCEEEMKSWSEREADGINLIARCLRGGGGPKWTETGFSIFTKINNIVKIVDITDVGDLVSTLSEVRTLLGLEPLNMDDER